MAYTNPIDPTDPANSDLVKNGAADMRSLKAAIIERVESFFADIDAQPWKIADGAQALGSLLIGTDLTVTDEMYVGSKLIGIGLDSSARSGAVAGKSGVSVSATPVVLGNSSSASLGGIGLVVGSNGTDRFTDLVLWDSTGTQTVTSRTSAGSPALRAYSTNGTGLLKLGMASGTYTVSLIELRAVTF